METSPIETQHENILTKPEESEAPLRKSKSQSDLKRSLDDSENIANVTDENSPTHDNQWKESDLDVLISQYVSKNSLGLGDDPQNDKCEKQEFQEEIWEGEGSYEELDVSQHFDTGKQESLHKEISAQANPKEENQSEDSEMCKSQYYDTPPLNETVQEGG